MDVLIFDVLLRVYFPAWSETPFQHSRIPAFIMIKLVVCLPVHIFQDTPNIAKVSNIESSGA